MYSFLCIRLLFSASACDILHLRVDVFRNRKSISCVFSGDCSLAPLAPMPRSPHGNRRAINSTDVESLPLMETSLLNRVQATLLALATAALFVLAVFNLLQERQFQQPDDGVWWREARRPAGRQGSARQARPARRHPDGDLLTAVSDSPTARVTPSRWSPTWSAPSTHRTLRPGLLHHHPRRHSARDAGQGDSRAARPQPAWPARHRPHLPDHRLLCSVPPLGRAARHAFLSLLPGLVRALRAQVHRPSSTRSTGRSSGPTSWPRRCSRRSSCTSRSASLRSASRISAAAGCCRWSTRRAPGCLACGSGPSPRAGHRAAARPAGPDRHRLRRCLSMCWPRCCSCAATAAPTTPLLRQQLKWVTRGTLLAVLPFTLFYAVPYPARPDPPRLLTNLAGLSLVFLPLTFSWAIVRYRLMDTDLIFKRGVAYTLATALILGGYFGVIALIAVVVHNACPKRARMGAWSSPFWSRRPSSIRSSAAFRAGWTAPSTAIATTTARRWSNSAAASAPKPIFRRCSTRSSSSCRARCWWRAWPSSSPRIRRPAPGRRPTACPPRSVQRAAATLDLGFLDFDQRPGPLAHLS